MSSKTKAILFGYTSEKRTELLQLLAREQSGTFKERLKSLSRLGVVYSTWVFTYWSFNLHVCGQERGMSLAFSAGVSGGGVRFVCGGGGLHCQM